VISPVSLSLRSGELLISQAAAAPILWE